MKKTWGISAIECCQPEKENPIICHDMDDPGEHYAK
jgi:hypothetical protein